jgi:hypothetical protein
MQLEPSRTANAHAFGPNGDKAVQRVAPEQLHRHPHENARAFSGQAQRR